MTDISHAGDVLNRVQELDNYISQALDALKSLQSTKQRAEEILQSIAQQKDELSRREQDLSGYLKTLQLVSQKADAILSPILKGKEDLEQLEKKVNERLDGIAGEIEKQTGAFVDRSNAEQKKIERHANDLVTALRVEFESGLGDIRRQQQESLASVTKSLEDLRSATNTHRKEVQEHEAALKGQNKTSEQLQKEAKTMQEGIKTMQEGMKKLAESLENVGQDFEASLKKLREEVEKEFRAALGELSEKHIKVLEKDDAQIKSALNGIIKKLSNVKFKKMLGLD